MATPFFQQVDALATPNGTWIKPGGRVAAYVRSTGAQEGDDLFAMSGGLVSTIAAGLSRCRSGMNDIVYVLPGHTETFSSSGVVFVPPAGAQIIGVGNPWATNAPQITLAHAGASLALAAANIRVSGLRIISTTAALTGAIVFTGASCTLDNCFVSLTGALAANPAIAVTAAPGTTIAHNRIVANCTDPIVEVTDAATLNMAIIGNLFRQTQGTSGGTAVTVADAAITGWIAHNLIGTATNGTPASLGIVIGTAALPGVHCFQNFCTDAEGGSGLITPANNDGN
ncbi:MAG TPA: hypothetical protein VFM95_06145 [Microcella sp.]|nr:hypothetical protein [Microcella sp.]